MFDFMDLVSKRYSSPFSLLDELIQNEEFDEWVTFIIKKDFKEKEERQLWEFYLAKVEEKSFNDWKTEVKSESASKDAMNEAKKEEIINKSDDILKSFQPQ